MADDAWQNFLAVLEQIGELKKSGVTGTALETLVEEAWDLWPEVPKTASGAREWPPGLIDVARELGFENSTATEDIEPLSLEDIVPPPAPTIPKARPTPPPMPRIDPEMLKLAKDIDEAIATAGGIGNLRVNCSRNRVTLNGIAADEDARDEAQIIAAKIAPGVEIDNGITVA